jgi:N-methylhydantoinase B
MTFAKNTSVPTEYDPITFSVLLSRFSSIAEEMTLTLEFTAWTSILALARDYSCAIYDYQSRQIAMFDALPIHTTSMSLVLDEIARTFEGDVNDGDIILCNAPYRGNTHVGDLVTATPVFVEGRHLFWAVTKGHQMDVGAAVPSSLTASARNIWQEGIQIPPVKIYDRGVIRHDVIDIYLSNVRYPKLQRGDLLAQLGSIGTGKQRLIELATEYGIDETLRYVDAMIDYADRRTGEAIRNFPNGTYTGQSWVDTDGVEATDIPIKVKVTVNDEDVHIDFSGSGPQAIGGANGTLATSKAAPVIPFLYYLDQDIPHNEGCFRHFEVELEEGSICLAKHPASTSLATIVPSDAMHEAVNRALVNAIPSRVMAGSARGANLPNFSGVDSRTGESWAAMFFNNGGGAGATSQNDGWPIIATLGAMGGLKSISCEQLELLYPLFVEEMEIEPDSMGFGRHNGGPGIRFAVRPTAGPVECITFGDGSSNPPHGVLGGKPGIGGGHYAENILTGIKRFVSSTGFYIVNEDERRVGVSSGGGGYGPPWEREVELVRRDVRDGFVSREVAERIFGVVMNDDFNPVVDEQTTEKLRKQLSKSEISAVDPTHPSASRWLKEQMGPQDVYLLNPVGE